MLSSNASRARKVQAWVDLEIAKEASEACGTSTLTVTNRGCPGALGVETPLYIGDAPIVDSPSGDLGLNDRDVDLSSDIWNICRPGVGRWTHEYGTGKEAFSSADLESRPAYGKAAGRRHRG